MSEKQDRITLLSSQLVSSQDILEIQILSVELQEAIRDHLDDMPKKLGAMR